MFGTWNSREKGGNKEIITHFVLYHLMKIRDAALPSIGFIKENNRSGYKQMSNF